MRESTRLPSSLATWVESVLGPLNCVRDASHARDNSQVWRVTGPAGDHYVKVAPMPILYTRETCAYRVAVPHLGHANAPVLHDSSAELLALILTAVDGVAQSWTGEPHNAEPNKHEGLFWVPMEKPPPDRHPYTTHIFHMLTHGPSYQALNWPTQGGSE
ncbi:hypothetical protein OG930_40105 [Streptomyces sp. NBC_01799]|uniref:hypothetical protein n=1 Tax=Streptomyces sp. NBC_01800 TaxID=2975945 RepID=UPI002DDB166B|nr:hypothetical protein [Streptomyces sp. NBC_01800]WSA72710.1 hypothetical protein OIE65_40700 [Streptomyces sp. NBC_01800]WSA81237.1 hypothetical protein OG930_40105 [Streptomyces sp. NBC_01799]